MLIVGLTSFACRRLYKTTDVSNDDIDDGISNGIIIDDVMIVFLTVVYDEE